MHFLFFALVYIRFTKPENFADCIGNELPLGWEEVYDRQIGYYYINHNSKSTQLEDPRLEWKTRQEEMLREYMSSAQETLEAKQEIYDVKQQRLQLAQDEYNHLQALATSRTSCKYYLPNCLGSLEFNCFYSNYSVLNI